MAQPPVDPPRFSAAVTDDDGCRDEIEVGRIWAGAWRVAIAGRATPGRGGGRAESARRRSWRSAISSRKRPGPGTNPLHRVFFFFVFCERQCGSGTPGGGPALGGTRDDCRACSKAARREQRLRAQETRGLVKGAARRFSS